MRAIQQQDVFLMGLGRKEIVFECEAERRSRLKRNAMARCRVIDCTGPYSSNGAHGLEAGNSYG